MPDATNNRPDWADDEDFDDPSALPPQQIIANPDGTKTIVTYRLSDTGKKIKSTRKIKTTVKKENVNPRIAERKTWTKFGLEKGNAPGPDLKTTTITENIVFKPSLKWKENQKEEQGAGGEKSIQSQLKDKKVLCRICKGDHFTYKCPFKDSMPLDEGGGIAGRLDDNGRPESPDPAPDPMFGGGSNSRYIAPHLRGKGGKGESMAGSGYQRDDYATLRVTNVSEMAEEADLREIFERFGKVTRVFLAKDRETGRAKGFAFVSFVDRNDAVKACEKIDGFGYGHLILKVEFAKRTST